MLLFGFKNSVRNNGRTADIYRQNEAFVRPFVISPDILSGGVAAGVEFCMSDPHPRTSQCHVNKRSFRSSRTKQMQTATHRTCTYCTVLNVYFVKSRMWALKYTRWGSEVRNKMQRTATGRTPSTWQDRKLRHTCV